MLTPRLSLLTLVLAATFCNAQAPANDGIVVSHHGNAVQLEVKRPVSVTSALTAVCSLVAASCDVSALPLSKQVAPLRISGDWEQVVGRLLDGTGFDYVAMGASGAFKPRLIVTVTNQSPTPAPPVERTAATAPAEAPVVSPSPALAQAAVESPAPSVSVPATEPAPASSPDYSASSGAPDGMNELPFSGPGGQSLFVPRADPNGPVQMPFAGPEGQISVPRASSEARYLPFPDANGNMIPAPPQTNDVHMIVPGPNGYQEIVSPEPH